MIWLDTNCQFWLFSFFGPRLAKFISGVLWSIGFLAEAMIPKHPFLPDSSASLSP